MFPTFSGDTKKLLALTLFWWTNREHEEYGNMPVAEVEKEDAFKPYLRLVSSGEAFLRSITTDMEAHEAAEAKKESKR
jgi:hypothetical protein